MSTLTACILVKNEEEILERAIRSIQGIVDTIYVLDTGSTDKTISILKKMGVEFSHYIWKDDFGDAMNVLFQRAEGEYLMLWDADFVLPSSSEKLLLQLKNSGFNTADIIRLRWNSDKDTGRWVLRDLIFKKDAIEWKYPVHSVAISKNKNPKIQEYPYISIDHLPKLQVQTARANQNLVLLKKGLQQYPNDPHLLFALADQYFSQKSFDQASQIFQKYLRYSSSEPEFRILLAAEKLTTSLILLKKYDTALRNLDTLAKQINSPILTLCYADVFLMIDPANALELYQKFVGEASVFPKEFIEGNLQRYHDHPTKMIQLLTGVS